MTVLLMRLAAPMQSWGTRSRFSVRDTEREPSKSGVIGIIAAAIGMKRSGKSEVEKYKNISLSDLANLKMGVRVNREGYLLRDFHTVGGGKVPGLQEYGVIKAGSNSVDTVVSTRYYLSDADFLVGLEGNKELLEIIHSALVAPIFPLFLGRKSFTPSIPIYISQNENENKSGLSEKSLEDALTQHTYYFRKNLEEIPDKIRLILETDFGVGEEMRMDNPESFEIDDRRYLPRYITTKWIQKEELLKIAVKEEI